jgi:BMFP domain-containing protein YqiC
MHMSLINQNHLQELAQQLTVSLPSEFKFIKQDIEKTFGAILQTYIAQLNLVSREEFEVQTLLLKKLQSKIDTLENQVTALEIELQRDPQGSVE